MQLQERRRQMRRDRSADGPFDTVGLSLSGGNQDERRRLQNRADAHRQRFGRDAGGIAAEERRIVAARGLCQPYAMRSRGQSVGRLVESDVSVAPDPEELKSVRQDPEALQKALSRAVDRVNAELSVIEKIRRFVLADEAFSVENEMLTPSMKIRRHVIGKNYGDRLAALYKK